MKGVWLGVGGLGLMVEGWGISNQRLFGEAALKGLHFCEFALKVPPSICVSAPKSATPLVKLPSTCPRPVERTFI